MKDYYKILGLYDDASQEEIRERWAELTRKHHPDRLKAGNGERIREINEAYQVLKDPATRFEYDFDRDLKKSVLKKKVVCKEEKKNPLEQSPSSNRHCGYSPWAGLTPFLFKTPRADPKIRTHSNYPF